MSEGLWFNSIKMVTIFLTEIHFSSVSVRITRKEKVGTDYDTKDQVLVDNWLIYHSKKENILLNCIFLHS